MIDLNPIRARITWLEVTIKDLVSSLDSAPEGLSDATRQHLSQGIVKYSLELKRTRDDLVASQELNDRALTDAGYTLTDKDYYS